MSARPETRPGDKALAAEALKKQAGKKKPARAEADALRRVRKQADYDKRQEIYAAIPKAEYIDLCGRPTKVLHDQADRYGFPLRGARLDLGKILRSMHDFFAKHKHTLANLADSDDPLLAGASQSLKDEYTKEQIAEKREKAKLARLERLEREGQLIPRDEMHALAVRWSSILREAGARLQRAFGPEAAELLGEALDNCDRETTSFYGDRDPD